MADLIANTPCAGLLPLTIGAITLEEVVPARIASVSPTKGKQKALNEALKASIGAGLPAPNRTHEAGDTQVIWAGIDQWLVFDGELPDLAGVGAVTDQSDAWAIVRVSGATVEDVLARLVPVDLRRKAFRKGHTARTMIAHMTGSVTRIGAESFDIMVMRSMAATLVHDLERAAQGVAAR